MEKFAHTPYINIQSHTFHNSSPKLDSANISITFVQSDTCVTFGVYSVNDRPTLLWRDWPSVVFVYMMAAHRVAYVRRVR